MSYFLRNDDGVSAVEVVVAAFVAAAIAVPLVALLSQQRDAGQRSRFEYLALLAARDAAYESRFLAAAGLDPAKLEQDWTSQTGSVYARLGQTASGLRAKFEYPPEQARIQTHVAWLSGQGRQRLGRVKVRWQEPDNSGSAGASSRRPSETDRVAWDLRAPLRMDLTVTLKGGPTELTQQFTRGQELAVTDTSPPACEFALFSYMPPPTEDWALNDLQRGGRFSVHPTRGSGSGRVMVRGPLMLLPEDAPPSQPHLGGSRPPAGALGYPVDGEWTGWAALPGPRALDPPPQEDGFSYDILGLSFSTEHRETRRPSREQSPSFKLGPFGISVLGKDLSWSWDLGRFSLVLAFGLDRKSPYYLNLMPGDEVAHFPPGRYLHAPLPRARQTFSILGDAPAGPTGPGAVTPRGVFRGAHLPAGAGGAPKPYAAGLSLPVTGQEGEAIVPEPVPAPAKGALKDLGILAFYGSARFDAKTLYSISLLDLFAEAIVKLLGPIGAAADAVGGVVETVSGFFGADVEIDPADAAAEALEAAGIDPAIELLIRNYRVTAGKRWDAASRSEYAGLTFSSLQEALEKGDGAVVPYGLYLCREDFWQPRPGLEARASALLRSLRQQMTDRVKNRLLAIAADDLLGEVFSGSVALLERALGQVQASMEAFFKDATAFLEGHATAQLRQLGDEARALRQLAAARKLLSDELRQRVATLRSLADERVSWAAGAFGPPELPGSELPEVAQQVDQWLRDTRKRLGVPDGAVPGPRAVLDQGQDWLEGASEKSRQEAESLRRKVRAHLENALSVTGPSLTEDSQRKAGSRNGQLPDAWRSAPWTRAFSEEALAEIRKYDRGYFPPKYRKWEAAATRRYPDFQTYLRAETGADGVLRLQGAVLLRELHYSGPAVRYRGRGLIIVASEAGLDEGAGPVLDAEVTRADAADKASHLVLVHAVAAALMNQGKRPPLALGPRFEGTVVSDAGVSPARDGCVIDGNLVTGLINKAAIREGLSDGNQGVHVVYDPGLAAATSGSRERFWTVELSGEISGAGARDISE